VKRLFPAFIVASSIVPALAQLSPDQRVLDFQSVVSFYARNYAPAPWKAESLGFNLFDTAPWTARVRAAKDDLEYLGILLEFVGNFRDTHTSAYVPSTLYARLGFTTDLYDGKVVIDGITRSLLPEADYPFQIGDEVVSVDGKSAEAMIAEYSRYLQLGNPRATRRFAAATIARRYQEYDPRTVELKETATVEIRRAGTEAPQTYTIRWTKTGVGVSNFGPIPNLTLSSAFGVERIGDEPPSDFRYSRRRELPAFKRRSEGQFLASIGAVRPGFDLPETATVRSNTPVYSALYESDGFKIGFLRVPSFSYGSTSARTIAAEIAFYQENADGLVIDIMRNPGGSCQFDDLAELVIPGKWMSTGDRYRPTLSLISSWRSYLGFTSGDERASLQEQLTALESAYAKGDLLAPVFPVCGYSFERESPATAFSKPLVVLIDEFSISAADFFAVTLKDNKRGVFVGKRSNGAGGAVTDGGPISFLSELTTDNTISLGTRPGTTDKYFENVGVEPDVELELMTLDNLTSRGKPFVDGFTKVVVDEIKKAKEAAPPPSASGN